MPSTDLDLDMDNPKAVGVLDRLTTNVAMAMIAVLPTLAISLFMPWRLQALLAPDEPEGRKGLLLAPGAFLPLSLFVCLMASALVATPEDITRNAAFIGPRLAFSIQSAIAEGNILKAVAAILPIYVFTVIVGGLGSVLRPLTRQDWTLRISLRAVFYVVGAVVSLIILVTALADLSWRFNQSGEIASLIYRISPFLILSAILWIYLWIFRNGGSVSWVRSIGLSLAMISLKFIVLTALQFLSTL